MRDIGNSRKSALVSGLLLLAGCGETLEARYSTLAEARASGAVSRGWIPEWLPLGSTNIREVHNLDTNNFMVRFEFPRGAPLELPRACVPVAPDKPPKPPFRRAWWPSDVPPSGLATHRYAFFGCESTFVAYASASGEGLVWQAK